MIYHKTVRSELGRSFSATLMIILTVVMTMMLIRVLKLATNGEVNPTDVLLVLFYFVLGHLPTILILSLFVGIVACLTRMYRDSEMVIWFNSGKGLSSLISPILQFSWPILLMIALLTTFVWPWTNEQTQLLRNSYEQRGDLDRVTPGQFQESSDGSRVFFIDTQHTINPNAPIPAPAPSQTGIGASTPNAVGAKLASLTSRNIFVFESKEEKEAVVVSQSGRIVQQPDGQYLILEQGQRYERNTENQNVKISQFESFGQLIKPTQLAAFATQEPRAKMTWALLSDRNKFNDAELAWRASLILASINFILLAIAVSAGGGSRTGRGRNMTMALLTFVIYYNMINFIQRWVMTERSGLIPALLILHGTVFLIAAIWLTARHNHGSVAAMIQNILPTKRRATHH